MPSLYYITITITITIIILGNLLTCVASNGGLSNSSERPQLTPCQFVLGMTVMMTRMVMMMMNMIAMMTMIIVMMMKVIHEDHD